MISAFKALKEQHNELQGLLVSLKKSIEENQGTTQNLLGQFQVKILEHHSIEQSELFKILENKKQIHSGGPFCVLYFDSFIRRRPSALVQKFCLNHIDSNWSYPESKNLLSSLSTNHPLSVPLEYHQQLEKLTSALIFLSQSANPSPRAIEEGIGLLTEIAKANFEKEENCLFSLAAQILDADDLNRLAARFGT